MPGPGQQLRDERLRRDMTLEQVAEALHLDRKTISHLEADDYPALPPMTFVQGYVRSYSQLLGLPAEPLLARLAEMAGDDRGSPLIPRAGTDSFGGAKPRAALRAGPGPLTLGLGIILLLGVLSAAGWWLSQNQNRLPFINGESSETSQPTPETEGDASALSGTATSDDQPAELQDPAPADSADVDALEQSSPIPQSDIPGSPEAEQSSPASSVPLQEPSDVSAPLESERASVTEPAEDDQALVFRLSGDSWLEVTDAAGERLYFGMAGRGEQRLAGEPPFDIVIGNTDSVELEFSGELINLQTYARNKVARFTLGDS